VRAAAGRWQQPLAAATPADTRHACACRRVTVSHARVCVCVCTAALCRLEKELKDAAAALQR
jgi:hypothetical protein